MKSCDATLAPGVTLADKPEVTIAEIHVDEELLDGYLLRRTDAIANQAVAQHLAECRECIERWIQLVELPAALAVVAE